MVAFVYSASVLRKVVREWLSLGLTTRFTLLRLMLETLLR